MRTDDMLARPYSVLLADAMAEKPALPIKTCLWCKLPFTSGFGVFCSKRCAMAEVQS